MEFNLQCGAIERRNQTIGVPPNKFKAISKYKGKVQPDSGEGDSESKSGNLG